jgi:hypothetical protein
LLRWRRWFKGHPRQRVANGVAHEGACLEQVGAAAAAVRRAEVWCRRRPALSPRRCLARRNNPRRQPCRRCGWCWCWIRAPYCRRWSGSRRSRPPTHSSARQRARPPAPSKCGWGPRWIRLQQTPAKRRCPLGRCFCRSEGSQFCSDWCAKWRSPRDGAEVSDFNGLKKSLGSNCLVAFQSVSERLPKRALKAMKAEPRR